MTLTNESSARRLLRVWPGIVFASLQVLTWLILPKVFPEQGMYFFFGTLLGGVAIVIWWLFFSRALWSERLGMLLLAGAALFATSRIIHPSIAGVGMGMLFVFFGTPLVCFAFAVAVAASHRLGDRARRTVMVAAILMASGGWALVRTGGISATGGMDVAWRWSPTPEERLLAESKDEPKTPPPTPAPVAAEPAKEPAKAAASEKPAQPLPAPAATTAAEWPGFRGANRDSIIPGVRIDTNWPASPPVEIWRRPVGPAWSSFAISGGLFYTQEQRGEQEVVACYNLKTGKPVWMHRDKTRFWEANAGPGPRGTPTLSGGRVYTFGATGIVNSLDAATGALVWSRNAASDTEAKVPYWGFASSPLVVNDMVIVAASGRLAAYDIATGKPRWLGAAHHGSYSSPQLLTIAGIPQIVLLNGAGAISVAPADGAVLWEHTWSGAPMVQPAMTADGDVLIATVGQAAGVGIRRLAVNNATGKWTVQERWTSVGLKPYFNDYVVHKGHAYGFDNSILACINLENGERKWKGGRYGNGQLVLLADQDLLLVLSEEGELALVAAKPDQFTELARIPAIEGKTWNHPAIAGDVLLVRNDHEMVAFRLRLTK